MSLTKVNFLLFISTKKNNNSIIFLDNQADFLQTKKKQSHYTVINTLTQIYENVLKSLDIGYTVEAKSK